MSANPLSLMSDDQKRKRGIRAGVQERRLLSTLTDRELDEQLQSAAAGLFAALEWQRLAFVDPSMWEGSEAWLQSEWERRSGGILRSSPNGDNTPRGLRNLLREGAKRQRWEALVRISVLLSAPSAFSEGAWEVPRSATGPGFRDDELWEMLGEAPYTDPSWR